MVVPDNYEDYKRNKFQLYESRFKLLIRSLVCTGLKKEDKEALKELFNKILNSTEN